jgi:integrase
MGKVAARLTEKRIEDRIAKFKAHPNDRGEKLSDGERLFLRLARSSAGNIKRFTWFFHHHLGNRKTKDITLGYWPEVNLKTARELREAISTQINKGDLSAIAGEPVRVFNGTPFSETCEKWFADKAKNWSEIHCRQTRSRIDRHVLPQFGAMAIEKITRKEHLQPFVESIKSTQVEARKVCEILFGVFEFAEDRQIIEGNPAATLKRLIPAHKTKHFAAITEPRRFGDLLRAIETYRGSTPITRYALRLLPLICVRPGNEFLHAQWHEIDLKNARWVLPGERMKMGDGEDDHEVSLPRQAVAWFKELRELIDDMGGSPYCFPGPRTMSRPMSNNTLNAALARLDFKGEQTAHGLRQSFQKLAQDELGIDFYTTDAQLHHAQPGRTMGYNAKTTLKKQRREAMQLWANYLDELRKNPEFVPDEAFLSTKV